VRSKVWKHNENPVPDQGRLPPSTHRYFWDIDPTTLVVGEYPVYVTERLLEYGDLEAVHWLLRRFSRNEIVNVLRHTRRVSPFSANFWALYFDLDREEVRCLSKQFQSERR
jgi:hypothetical protein